VKRKKEDEIMTRLFKIITTSALLLGGTAYSTTQINRNDTNQISSAKKQQECTLEEAKQIALQEVNGQIVNYEEDNDDYEIIIKKDGYLYQIEIDKKTGHVDDIDQSLILNSQTSNNKTEQSTDQQNQNDITYEEAKQIALKKVNGKITKEKEDKDDYEFKIEKDGYLYEIEIDKRTGQIDSFDKEKIVNKNNSNYKKVSLEEARQIALKKVNGKITKEKEDKDDYEFVIEKDGYLYEIEIDKRTGQIDDFDKEKIVSKKISIEEAKRIALKKVNGTILDVETDDDEYCFKIKKENYLYEIEIDAISGKVIEFDKEYILSEFNISKEEAKRIALNKINGKIIDMELDEDDCKYNIEILKEGIEYEVEVDASSGKILSIEKDD